MSATWELIVPVVVAIYSGVVGNDRCEIKPASSQTAENVCQGLRAGLEEGCDRLLSVPVGNTGVKLAGRYSVTPVQFPLLVKQKIGEAYHACDLFWSEDITFDQYRQRLATKASVLNELFSALPSAAPALETVKDAMRAAGVQDAELKNTSAALADLERQCKIAGSSTSIACKAGSNTGGLSDDHDNLSPDPKVPPTPIKEEPLPLLTLKDIQKLENSIALLSDKVDEIQRTAPAAPPLPIHWEAISEIGFAVGSHAIAWTDCTSLVKRMSSLKIKPRRILIVGSADARGEMTLNESLSLRRAASSALCLRGALGSATSMQITGTGPASTPISEYTRARAATVYAAY